MPRIGKQIVHYDANIGVEFKGGVAFVTPIDHPSELVTNTMTAMTSDVLVRHEDGVFETRNTIYMPQAT